uniref:HEPN domain-containing protein n=1 Tax=Cupriavidus taiwanensis TaxID=164546 RepID=UPI003F49A68F
MSTAVFMVACSIPGRIEELSRLTRLAEKEQTRSEESFNTLCRACSVLLASHLEGFLKDLSKSISVDLNYYLKSFSGMPEALKRSFCEKIAFYEGVPSDEVNKRITQLIAFFSANSVNIDLQAFTYKENKNRNAGPDVIDGALAKLGVPSVLNSMKNSRLENVFKNDANATHLIRRDLRRFRSLVYHYPYRGLPETYAFDFKNARGTQKGSSTSLWHTFIEEVMQRRHRIAHGDTMENDADATILTQDIEKLDVLMHGMLFAATTYLGKKS